MPRPVNNLVGQRFGRLVVIRDSGERSGKGSVMWDCACDCGAVHRVVSTNLRSGHVQSCGCLSRELSSKRQKARKRPPVKCQHVGCKNTIEKGGNGYCGMHAQRVRRYGDPDFITPEEERRANNRVAQLRRFGEVKPDTYRKYFGRHEHRVVAEQELGRPLRSNEHVHHIDENKHNNDPSNLQVVDAKDHIKHHAQKKKGRVNA